METFNPDQAHREKQSSEPVQEPLSIEEKFGLTPEELADLDRKDDDDYLYGRN